MLKEIQCDHIIPLGSNVPPGKPELFEILDRMECETELLQILCKPCHKIKTNFEKHHKSRLVMINTVAYYMGVQHGFLYGTGGEIIAFGIGKFQSVLSFRKKF